NGRYTVDKQQLRGLPETPQNVQTAFHLTIDGVPITYRLPVVYTKVDPARGEIIKNLEIVPPVSVKLAEEVYVFSDNEPKTVVVTVSGYDGRVEGTLHLNSTNGWRVEPASFEVNL